MLPRVAPQPITVRPPRVEACLPALRSALLVAHPGHELLLHGWLETERPRVYVLTDGSGRDGSSRLCATTRLLERAGARAGSVYGRYPDNAIYEALLDGDTALFVGLAEEIAKSLGGDAIERVVGDAAEGWNPIHDAFRLTVNAAAALASRELGRPLEMFEFALFGPPRPPSERALPFPLDARGRAAKRAAALGYAELDREVRWSIERYGEDDYATEWLRPSAQAPGEYAVPDDPPVYERYGDFLARSGQIGRAIRYREHLLPVAAALGAAVGRR
jgi:hypothetical protein